MSQVMPGWEIAEDLSRASAIVSLVAGTTTDILTIEVPSGGRFYIEALTARVIDAGSDQVSFSVLRNGMSIALGYTDIPATLFDYTAQFPISRDTPPGQIVVKGNNNAAGIIRVNVALKCYLLRETRKAGNPLRFSYEFSESQ